MGKFGSPESHRAYQDFLREWQQEVRAPAPRSGCIIADLVATFLRHAETHYRRPDGTQTDEVKSFRAALRPVLAAHASRSVDVFRQAELRAIRDGWITAGLARPTVNKMVGRVRRVWRWGVRREIVDPATLVSLELVEDLEVGRTEAHEPDPVLPADESMVRATLPFLSPTLRAMVGLMQLTGCRPNEACEARGCEINTMGIVTVRKRQIQLGHGVWAWQPSAYKTLHHGKLLVYALGPAAQELLTPWLRAESMEYLFQPAEAMDALRAERAAARKSKRPPSQLARRRKPNPKNPPRDHYLESSLAHAIARACERLAWSEGVLPEDERYSEYHWSPGQIRHAVLTRLDRAHGIEAASICVSHSTISTTEIYVERDLQRAAEIMSRQG